MDQLDDTDRAILRHLLTDARASWREIADEVDLSPPAVSDRVDRLRELGVIRRFTVDVDRSALAGGTPVLVSIDCEPGTAGSVSDALVDAEEVEHAFRTADERVVFTATVARGGVLDLLGEHADLADVRDFEVSLLAGRDWNPAVGDVELALTCAECGNTVTNEGTSTRLDSELYHFCCESCEASFVETYEELREGAD